MSLTQEQIMQWIYAPASRERKLDFSITHLCEFKRLLHKNHQFDLIKIYRR